ncbi:hypothetical protein THAOC_21240, partial [Thalassiosira oceanica]
WAWRSALISGALSRRAWPLFFPSSFVSNLQPKASMRVLLEKSTTRFERSDVANYAGGDPCFLDLLRPRVEVFPLQAVDQLTEAHISAMRVDAPSTSGQNIVCVGRLHGTAMAGRDPGDEGGEVWLLID